MRVVNMAENIEFFSPSETTDDESPNIDLFPELFNADNTEENGDIEARQVAQIDTFSGENAKQKH